MKATLFGLASIGCLAASLFFTARLFGQIGGVSYIRQTAAKCLNKNCNELNSGVDHQACSGEDKKCYFRNDQAVRVCVLGYTADCIVIRNADGSIPLNPLCIGKCSDGVTDCASHAYLCDHHENWP